MSWEKLPVTPIYWEEANDFACTAVSTPDALGGGARGGVRGPEAAAEAGNGAAGRLPEEDQVPDGDPTRARAAEARAEDLHT